MKDKVFTGYGVMVNDEIKWSEESDNPSLAKVVRDRDYPEGSIIFWVQSCNGGPTIHRVVG